MYLDDDLTPDELAEANEQMREQRELPTLTPREFENWTQRHGVRWEPPQQRVIRMAPGVREAVAAHAASRQENADRLHAAMFGGPSFRDELVTGRRRTTRIAYASAAVAGAMTSGAIAGTLPLWAWLPVLILAVIAGTLALVGRGALVLALRGYDRNPVKAVVVELNHALRKLR